MAREEPDKEDHDEMVRSWVKVLQGRGYTVKADLPEFKDKPSPVHGKIPDIEATNESEIIIGETETCESIGWDDTRDQFVAFTKGRSKTRKFHAQAPKKCLEDLKKQMRAWKADGYDIDVDSFWPYQ